MKSYNGLKTEVKAIQEQMVEAKKYEHANTSKEIKRLSIEFGFTALMPRVSLAEGQKTL